MTKNEANSPIHVCLLEDHADFRETLCEAIESRGKFAIDATFSTAEDLFEHLEESTPPDIIILDLGLPGMSGIEAIPEIKRLAPKTMALVLTVYNNKPKVLQALGAGASGYLIKSSGLNAIVSGIEDAYHGISPLSADIAQMVFNTFSKIKPQAPETELSKREVEVLEQLSQGLGRQEVANALSVSVHTVNTHIRHIYEKLQVHNLSGALSKAAAMEII